MVAQKYFWPGRNKDVEIWARSCIGCQRAKIQRDTVLNLGKFTECNRFEHIHNNLIGPLVMSKDYCIGIGISR